MLNPRTLINVNGCAKELIKECSSPDIEGWGFPLEKYSSFVLKSGGQSYLRPTNLFTVQQLWRFIVSCHLVVCIIYYSISLTKLLTKWYCLEKKGYNPKECWYIDILTLSFRDYHFFSWTLESLSFSHCLDCFVGFENVARLTVKYYSSLQK